MFLRIEDWMCATSKEIKKTKTDLIETSLIKLKASSALTLWLESTLRYPKDTQEQIQFERNVVFLTASSYTPLSLVEELTFRKMIADIDPRLNLISRSRLSWTLIPKIYQEIEADMKAQVDTITTSCLPYDLWMTRKIVFYVESYAKLKMAILTKHVHTKNHLTSLVWSRKLLTIGDKKCILRTVLKIISWTTQFYRRAVFQRKHAFSSRYYIKT